MMLDEAGGALFHINNVSKVYCMGDNGHCGWLVPRPAYDRHIS